MKKKITSFALALCMGLVCCAALVGCSNKSNNSKELTYSISDDYNYQAVAANIESLEEANGIKITVNYSVQEVGEEAEQYTLTYAAKNNVYYVKNDDSELYIDLRGEDSFYVYSYNGSSWNRQEVQYTEELTKEYCKQLYVDLNSAMFLGCMTAYSSLVASTDVQKATATIAGRSCDKYTYKFSGYGVRVSYEICIDKQTGACLKWAGSGYADGEGGSYSFVCTEFNTNPTITLPSIH